MLFVGILRIPYMAQIKLTFARRRPIAPQTGRFARPHLTADQSMAGRTRVAHLSTNGVIVSAATDGRVHLRIGRAARQGICG